MNKKVYALEIIREVTKDNDPKVIIAFMKEMAKILKLKQFREGKDKSDIPVVISEEEYEELIAIKKIRKLNDELYLASLCDRKYKKDS